MKTAADKDPVDWFEKVICGIWYFCTFAALASFSLKLTAAMLFWQLYQDTLKDIREQQAKAAVKQT